MKTVAVVAGTAAAIAALPLIGVSSAVGASILAIGFAGVAVYNGIKHISNAVKHNKSGENNNLREDLKNIGGDGLDLALSVPFVPKGIKTVTNTLKYGPKIGLNAELLNGLKESKGINGVLQEFAKADLKIKYHQMAGEMGLKVKPELIFNKNVPTMYGAFCEPAKGVVEMNTKYLSPIQRGLIRLSMKAQKAKLPVCLSPEGFLRHELEHVGQFQNIARTENIGTPGLADAISKRHTGLLPQKEQGLTQTEAQLEALRGYTPKTKLEKIMIKEQIPELEKTANFLKSQITLSREVIANGEGAMNLPYYNQVIKQSGTIKAGSQEAELSSQYLQGFMGKLQDQQRIAELQQKAATEAISASTIQDECMEIYEGNIIEKPAYKALREYISKTLKHRPSLLTASIQSINTFNN